MLSIGIAGRRLAAWAVLNCLIITPFIAGPARAGEPVWLVDLSGGRPGAYLGPSDADPPWRIGFGGAALPALTPGAAGIQLGPIARLDGSWSLFAGPSLSFGGTMSTPAMLGGSGTRWGLAAGGSLPLNESITLNTAMGWLRKPMAAPAPGPRPGEELFVGTIGLGLRF